MQHTPKFHLLTFYKFVDIADPQEEVKKHKIFCEDIGIK
jgi:predicted sulfurtransferase